ncbi:hypothetical protein [Thalassobellus suaedae]|uniref:Uncharacterized protein n=1 Tax=Thalassobellus suaedae TaxID=3074124 RepID=A0ABY9XPS8_9FLAO|nr:hypothetical protein RHP51_11890 [Flavobacteriaceae bacterium HL-DH14]WNH13208.1 hypothetical protein RHP49_02890 [Flavobacteriaceae bacterium HL-DH10]
MQKKNINNINETGFKVPKDYFNTLEDSILSEIKLKELSSVSGFKTPKDYFETLEDRIIEKTSNKKTPKVISIFNKRNLVYISSVAAAVLLLFNLSIFKNTTTWASLDTETVEDYMMSEDVLDSYEIASLLTTEELNNADFIEIDFNENNIETYLINHLDVEDLYFE